jgi:hypothetical protein
MPHIATHTWPKTNEVGPVQPGTSNHLNHAFSLDSSTTVLFYMKSASLYMSVKYLKYPTRRGPPGRTRVWQWKDYGRWNKTTWVHDENICKKIPPRRTNHTLKIAWWRSGERNKLSSPYHSAPGAKSSIAGEEYFATIGNREERKSYNAI